MSRHGYHSQWLTFRKLRRPSTGDPVRDPIGIFQTLPKPEHVNDLWDTQAAALRAWHARRGEGDLAIKLNTGSGKTLVGLLIGESVRRELQQPILYLAPTRQLVTQVVEKAAEFGISAEPYQPGGGLPASFRNAEAILVGSYQMLFNGRTVFGLLGRSEPVPVGGIVLDDAHTSAATLREIFSISVSRSKHKELYRDLAGRFRRAFEKVHSVGRLDDMLARRDEGVMEVPNRSWLDQAAAVREKIQSVDDDPFRFSLPLVRDHFLVSHALVSKDAFTITPMLPPIHVVPSFANCAHRVFMSATLSDDGLLVRTFGASVESISRPITTRSVAGLGERMILAPTLSGLSRDSALAAACSLADTVRELRRGAVVLVPSVRHAESSWAEVGEICIGDAVTTAVDRLQRPEVRAQSLPILVNRYDGIDLPQDSCRLLILDGRPRGSNQYDLYRASVLQGHSSINIELAQRVEQGMGRGTRGAGDFCVVLLLGADLVGWLGQRDTQQTLTPGTRAQVILGREIAGHVRSSRELLATAQQCLDRDDGWKQIHALRIAEAGEVQSDTRLVRAGRVERRAFEMLLYDRFKVARDFLTEQAQGTEWDDLFRGWLLQLASRAASLAGDFDRGEALQVEAHAMNRALTKPQGEVQYQPLVRGTPQATKVVEIVEQYALRAAVLEEFDTALADLHTQASANRFEGAIESVGRFLGFESDRPESNTRFGPDNQWLGDGDLGFVIECKHQKTRPINKQDHGQLRVTEQWFRQHYPASTAHSHHCPSQWVCDRAVRGC